MYVCVYVCICTCMYVCMHACMHARTYVRTYVCIMYVCVCLYIYIYRQGTGSALVQVMACRLFRAKPLSKPVLGYCQLDPSNQASVKFQSKYQTFKKCIWVYRLRNGGHFVQGKWDHLGSISMQDPAQTRTHEVKYSTVHIALKFGRWLRICQISEWWENS